MQTRPLGRTGIQVSAYALGTMMFGPYGNPDPDDCVRIVHRALDGGINVIDTADVYGGDGESEKIVGKALRGRRDDVVLATKFNGPMGSGPNQRGSSRRWIVSAVEGSLRRLGVDHIDLYQAHHPEPGTDVEETLGALTDLLRAGKVRAIGHSNLPASDIVEAQWVAERCGWPASAPSSRITRSSTAGSNARSCRSASATGWVSWCGARWRWACSPVASVRAARKGRRPVACAGRGST